MPKGRILIYKKEGRWFMATKEWHRYWVTGECKSFVHAVSLIDHHLAGRGGS